MHQDRLCLYDRFQGVHQNHAISCLQNSADCSVCALVQLLPRVTYLLQAQHAPGAFRPLLSLLYRVALGGLEYCQEITDTPGLVKTLQGVLDSPAAPLNQGDLIGPTLWACRGPTLRLVCVLAESSASIARTMGAQGVCEAPCCASDTVHAQMMNAPSCMHTWRTYLPLGRRTCPYACPIKRACIAIYTLDYTFACTFSYAPVHMHACAEDLAQHDVEAGFTNDRRAVHFCKQE